MIFEHNGWMPLVATLVLGVIYFIYQLLAAGSGQIQIRTTFVRYKKKNRRRP